MSNIQVGKASRNGVTPDIAIETRGWMAKDFGSPTLNEVFMRGVMPFVEAQVADAEERVEYGMALGITFYDALISGETLLIQEETMRLVAYAAEELPPEDSYDVNLPLFPQAVIFFQHPYLLTFVAKNGEKAEMRMRWVIFDGMDPGTHYYFVGVSEGSDPWSSVRNIGITAMADYSTLGKMNLPRGWEMQHPGLRDDEYVAMVNVKPLMQAMWALLRQPITTEAKTRAIGPPARKARKRLKSDGTVRVINIRQTNGGGGSGAGGTREYTHRWIVRGHWRMQVCGPGRKERKRTWIDVHVAGPSDKPLVMGEKVYRA